MKEAKPNCPCDEFVFPPPVKIPPGLSSLSRQLIGFSDFRLALLAGIQTKYSLRHWRARSNNDFGMMLLEMWAYICDVLCFYDEVITNRCFVRTAPQRSSLRKLVGILGYLPRPAIGASVKLAAVAEGRQAVSLPKGTAFRSGAFNGHPPQVFELDADTTIHPTFNRWVLKANYPDTVESTSFLLLKPATVRAKREEFALLQYGANTKVLRIQSLTPFLGRDGERYTRIDFSPALNLPANTPLDSLHLRIPTSTASLWRLPSPTSNKFIVKKIPFQNTLSVVKGDLIPLFVDDDDPPVISDTSIVLDGLYRQIRSGDFILLEKKGEFRFFQVEQVSEAMRKVSDEIVSTVTDSSNKKATVTSPAVRTPVTMLTLDKSINHSSQKRWSEDWDSSNAVDIVVHYNLVDGGVVAVEALTTLSANDLLQVEGNQKLPNSVTAPGAFLLEDRNHVGLPITGQLDFNSGKLTLDATVDWKTPLDSPVEMVGNLLQVSRGQTINGEILGSGNASIPNQKFKLQKKPLTYLPYPSSGNDQGISSTLRVYVNRILWQEVPSFFGVAADAQVYIVRQDDHSDSWITFGDGTRGSRLPSGINNVLAIYRFGAEATSPPAGSIHQLARPVMGLKSIRNPVAASGGDDAEGEESLRRFAPRSALLLGRVVSMSDIEAATGTVGGVRAVQVEWRWNATKQRPVVQVYYIGGIGLKSLIVAKLRSLTDPSMSIDVTQANAIPQTLSIDIEVDSRFYEIDVLTEVRESLTNAKTGILAPEQIGIGVALFRSRLLATILAVPGTVSVRALTVDNQAFPDYGISPGAGNYFDFGSDRLLLNGKGSDHG